MADTKQRCVYCGTELTDGIPVCPRCGRDNSVPVLGGKKLAGSDKRRKGRKAEADRQPVKKPAPVREEPRQKHDKKTEELPYEELYEEYTLKRRTKRN